MSKYRADNHIIGKVYDLTQENMQAMILDIEGLVDDNARLATKNAELERLTTTSKSRQKRVCIQSQCAVADALKEEVEDIKARLKRTLRDANFQFERAEAAEDKNAELESENKSLKLDNTRMAPVVLRRTAACEIYKEEKEAAEQQVKELREALHSVHACFIGAECEGLLEKLQEADKAAGTLGDLVERRLMFADTYALEALTNTEEK